MIFSGQETHELFSEARKDKLYTYKSKEIQNPGKIAEIMNKNGFLASFNFGGALGSVFNFLKF